MHIAFSVVRGLRAVGGIEKYTAELGTRLVSRGHEVTVFSFGARGAVPSTYMGMQVVSCPALPGKYSEKLTAGAWAALRILVGRDFDIVHQHSIAAGAFNWLAGWPGASLLQMHGTEWQRTKWGPLARWSVRKLEQIAIGQYRYFTAVSRAQCRGLRERYGIDPVYIPTATEIRPKLECDRIRKEYALERGSYILFVGRLVPEKGAHCLIEAYRAARTDLCLVIAGDAPTEPDYVRSLKERARGDARILFPGSVTGPRLQELFSNCYFYVQPSFVEGLSIALIEAMSYGNCCLVSDIEENREAIGDAGVTFRSEAIPDLTRQLESLIASPDQVVERGEAARLRVSAEYSWSTVTTRMEELYDRVMRQ